MLEEIDRLAMEERGSRGAILREAVRAFVQMRQARRRRGRSAAIQQAMATQDAISRQDSVAWGGVAEIRRWRARR